MSNWKTEHADKLQELFYFWVIYKHWNTEVAFIGSKLKWNTEQGENSSEQCVSAEAEFDSLSWVQRINYRGSSSQPNQHNNTETLFLAIWTGSKALAEKQNENVVCGFIIWTGALVWPCSLLLYFCDSCSPLHFRDMKLCCKLSPYLLSAYCVPYLQELDMGIESFDCDQRHVKEDISTPWYQLDLTVCAFWQREVTGESLGTNCAEVHWLFQARKKHNSFAKWHVRANSPSPLQAKTQFGIKLWTPNTHWTHFLNAMIY